LLVIFATPVPEGSSSSYPSLVSASLYRHNVTHADEPAMN
jgi:hypothetical protein